MFTLSKQGRNNCAVVEMDTTFVLLLLQWKQAGTQPHDSFGLPCIVRTTASKGKCVGGDNAALFWKRGRKDPATKHLAHVHHSRVSLYMQ